jgi:8-oxo-dGTP pyrophosphatase MutT (NUDIX family)
VFDVWSFIFVSVVAFGRIRRSRLWTRAAPSWFPLATMAGMSTLEDNPWRRISRRIAYENPWLKLYHDDVIRPDGQPGIYGVVHFGHLAIGVVPLDVEHDAVLLVGQYRYTLDHYSWEIPEGGGRFDEDPEAAARRELVEETGYSGGEWRELCRAELSNSVTDEITVLFVAKGLVAGPASPEGTEQLQVRWVAFDDVMAMIRHGEIADAMTILAMQQLALERAAGR